MTYHNSPYPAPGSEPFNLSDSEMEEAWEGVGIRPIETHWRGYHFRSRLEARWAVFFTEMGVAFEYEPEGFHLPSGKLYLPDFRLPQIKFWAEVKPGAFSDPWKSRELSMTSGWPLLQLVGPPDFIPYVAILPQTGWTENGREVLGPLECSYSLDIHYGQDYYLSENRLFSDPADDQVSLDQCSARYRQAVYESRGARFARN